MDNVNRLDGPKDFHIVKPAVMLMPQPSPAHGLPSAGTAKLVVVGGNRGMGRDRPPTSPRAVAAPWAIFFRTQTVAGDMADAGRGGAVVNIGSMQARQATSDPRSWLALACPRSRE